MVKVLHDVSFPKNNPVIWDGNDDSGSNLPNGVYYVRIRGENRFWTTPCVKIR
jgi:flagellar hook assembly protein FlgD